MILKLIVSKFSCKFMFSRSLAVNNEYFSHLFSGSLSISLSLSECSVKMGTALLQLSEGSVDRMVITDTDEKYEPYLSFLSPTKNIVTSCVAEDAV